MKIRHKMSFAYFTVVFGILMAKAAGFIRDIIFAKAFGTTAESDIYFQIYGVVNLVFTCLGIALSTLVIKNLNKEENATEEKKRAYVSAFLQRTALWLIIVTAVLYAGARIFVYILLPNIDEQYVGLAMRLTYLMLPSLFCVVIAYIISGVLQNNRVFFIPSIVS
ncbi:MAG: lipid II flippase MurJ, partial [Eubacteriales bacterium]